MARRDRVERHPALTEDLDREARTALHCITYEADETALWLRRVWHRPERRNRRAERAALWRVLRLNEWIDQINAPEDKLARMLRPIGDTAMRLGILSGIVAVPHLAPFDASERRALVGDDFDLEFKSRRESGLVVDVAIREPALFERWQDWLWVGRDQRPQQPQPSPDGLLLGEGCYRLARDLGELFGWEVHAPPPAS